VSSAYLRSKLPGLRVERSETAIVKRAGPIAEPCTTLEEMGRGEEVVLLKVVE
jgi:hypothetical protein